MRRDVVANREVERGLGRGAAGGEALTTDAAACSVTLPTVDVTLTAAQARALAVIANYHPGCELVVYPPVCGAIGVRVEDGSVEGRLYTVERDGTETS